MTQADDEPTDPSSVSDLSVTGSTSTSLTVRWTGVSDGDGGAADYILRYASPTISWGDADGTDQTVTNVSLGGTGSHTITGLSDGTDYEVQLISYRGTLHQDAVFSGLSNVAAGTTQSDGGQEPDVGSVTASPGSADLDVGATVQLSATVRDTDGDPMSEPVSWSSWSSSIATVNSAGMVSAVSPGLARIVATVEGMRDTVMVTVTSADPGPTTPATVTDLRVTGRTENTITVRWTGVGDGDGGRASYLFRYASPTISWGSADGTDQIVNNVAVGANGSFTFTGLNSGSDYEFQLITFRGTIALDAVFGSLSNVAGGTTDTEEQEVGSVTASPGSADLEAGETTQLNATVRDTDGGTMSVPVSWSSWSPSIATVSSTGMVTGVSEGLARVVATASGHADTVMVNVEEGEPEPQSPASVTDLRVTSESETTITVRWTGVNDGAGNGASYLLRSGSPTISWGSADGSDKIVTGVSIGGTGTYTWTGLDSDTDYQFQLISYRGPQPQGATYGGLSNITSGSTDAAAQQVTSILTSPSSLTLSGAGAVGTIQATARTAGGVTVPTTFTFTSTNPSVAVVGQSGLVTAVAPGTATIQVRTSLCSCVGTSSVVVDNPAPPGAFHEPGGFTMIHDEPWNNFDKYNYWTRDNQPGSVVANGSVTWTYPAGFQAGYTAGSRVIRMDTPNHGPYQYNRDEGVTLSSNWFGGPGGVNKFRFWSRTNEEIHGYLMFEGHGNGTLRPAINTQGFPMSTVVWRWDDSENLANPTEAQTRVTRGVPHTVETLMYKGTPGNSDGWVKVWLDGVLVLHFANKALCASGDSPQFGPIHYAPIWGGVGGTVPSTQTMSIGYSYASRGSSAN